MKSYLDGSAYDNYGTVGEARRLLGALLLREALSEAPEPDSLAKARSTPGIE